MRMAPKMLLVILSMFVLEIATAITKEKAKTTKVSCCPQPPQAKKKSPNAFTPGSCLDYLKKGYKSNGFYKIYKYKSPVSSLTVYCDMESEAGAAWTLVESFALKNIIMPEFTTKALKVNAPVNENSPNWNLYRMTHSHMTHIKSQSTHWRITCSFPKHGVDYTDYVRATFANFDPMTFAGSGVCKKVEFINIRGHRCAHCTSEWWQTVNRNSYGLHTDSNAQSCQFKPKQDAIPSEDNFGFYRAINHKFRCTSDPNSTTNLWFGGYH